MSRWEFKTTFIRKSDKFRHLEIWRFLPYTRDALAYVTPAFFRILVWNDIEKLSRKIWQIGPKPIQYANVARRLETKKTAERRCNRIYFEPWSILATGGRENSRKLWKPIFTYLFIFAFNFIQFCSLEAMPSFLTWAPVLSWSTSAVLVNAMVLFIKHFRKTQRQIVGKWI